MSWDYDDDDQRERDYYDSRCYPEEYDSIEEYRLEHECRGGRFSPGSSTPSNVGIGSVIFTILAIFAMYYILLISVFLPPVGVLLFLGLIKLKSWFT